MGRSCFDSEKNLVFSLLSLSLWCQLGNSWGAAKDLELAAGFSKDSGDPSEKSAMFHRRAYSLYMEAGKAQRGAEVLIAGGKMIEEDNPKLAAEMYGDACETLVEEGKEAFAGARLFFFQPKTGK